MVGKRIHPKKHKISTRTLVLVLVILVTTWLGLNNKETGGVLSLLSENQPGMYRVVKVDDGDTITVDMDGTEETIRLIGVDTPEKNHPKKPVQCFALAASAHLQQLIGLEAVRLEADPLNQNRDRYGRLLRYVYLADGTLLNAEQIEDGYGFAYTAFSFSKLDEFVALENEARTAELGLWGECNPFLDNGYMNTEPV